MARHWRLIVSNCIIEDARPLMELAKGFEGDDPNELIKNRFLCKGGGLLIVGQTGIGKSSLARQMALQFAQGKECVGLIPKRPLKSLIIQAENDDADEAAMRDGVLEGNPCSDEEKEKLREMVYIASGQGKTGWFFFNWLNALLEKYKPDLLWIDPVLAYLGGNANDQEIVGGFLRVNLAPLLTRHRCAVAMIHHTGKAKKSVDQDSGAYFGAGSAEWANWSRAVLVLENEGDGNFTLHATKRGKYLKWMNYKGESCTERSLAHSRDEGLICWETRDNSEIQSSTKSSGRRPTMDEFLAIFPRDLEHPENGILSAERLREIFPKKGWSKSLTESVRDEALEKGSIILCPLSSNGKHVGLPEIVAEYKRRKGNA